MSYARWRACRPPEFQGMRIFCAPTWGRARDTDLLMRYADDPRPLRAGKIDRFYLLAHRPLNEGERAALDALMPYLGLGQFRRILDLRAKLGFAPRSESDARLQTLWQLECLQFFMHNRTELLTPWHLVVARAAVAALVQT